MTFSSYFNIKGIPWRESNDKNKLVTSLMPFISGKTIQGLEFSAWQVAHSSTMMFGQEWAV